MVDSSRANQSHNNPENSRSGSTSTIELAPADYDISAAASPVEVGLRQKYVWIYKYGVSLCINSIAVGFLAWATYYHIDLSNRFEQIEWPPVENDCSDDGQCAVTTTSYCPTYCGIQWCDGFGILIIMYAITYICLFYYKFVKPQWGNTIFRSVLQPIGRTTTKALNGRFRQQIAAGISLLAILAYLIIDSLDTLERLQSISGIFVFFLIGYLCSAHRNRINYQIVFWGFVLQFLLGVVCIRWDVGRNIFQCIGNKVNTFLNYTDVGSTFIYGAELVDKRIFAFTVMPIVFFYSMCISILYYLGAVQWIVMKIGWILRSIMETTVCESVTCAANIALGMCESSLLIRPYIKYLTNSEMHTIMSSGFATVSGTVLAAYIAYGAEPAHLITSSVMAAPAALGFSKLFYPETEESRTKSNNMVLEKSTDSSILDAASNGALLAIPIVLGIAANLVAIVSFVAFLNGVVSYLGFLVGFENVTFELILSKLFIPLAWVIGIPWEDCEKVAYIIASKSIINEFVAYERLGVLKRDGMISLRSSAITTYAICGFANPSAVGILVATIGSIAPEKRQMVTAVGVRALIAGSMICFLTASIAGVLMTDDMFEEY